MTTQHTALYRKYRPADFDEVRNQEHIVSVLKGAIAKNTIPHALLFTGTRGTGKTTLARIFARALGAVPEDIYEIDAASYNSVDDIRELNDAVYTLPFNSPYKVYIMDEVHMLSKQAWNAFLKTLEEPPAHVIFILATTELEKVLETVISRCQVFHLRPPTRADIRKMIIEIAEQEQFALTADAAELIAVAANGSFRDALSIAQKVFMASNDVLADADEVARIIGAPKIQLVSDVLGAIAEKDVKTALARLGEASVARVDMKLFMKLLIERVRAAMLYRGTKDAQYISTYSDEEKKRLEQYALPTSALNSRTLARLLEAYNQTGMTHISELPLELAIIDICTSTSSVTGKQS